MNALDVIDSAVIRMKYFENAEMDIIAKTLGVSIRAIYKRLDKIIDDINYCLLTGS